MIPLGQTHQTSLTKKKPDQAPELVNQSLHLATNPKAILTPTLIGLVEDSTASRQIEQGRQPTATQNLEVAATLHQHIDHHHTRARVTMPEILVLLIHPHTATPHPHLGPTHDSEVHCQHRQLSVDTALLRRTMVVYLPPIPIVPHQWATMDLNHLAQPRVTNLSDHITLLLHTTGISEDTPGAHRQEEAFPIGFRALLAGGLLTHSHHQEDMPGGQDNLMH